MNNPKAVGEISEGCILALLLRAGAVVLVPFGNNQRYDFVAEVDGKFIRIQCKTGRKRGAVIQFNSCSFSGGKKRRVYTGEADVFAVYCQELEKMYIVPVACTGKKEVWLRLDDVKNKQVKMVRMARDYEFRSVDQLVDRHIHNVEAAGS